jgi:hydrogenase 3 maturation protease
MDKKLISSNCWQEPLQQAIRQRQKVDQPLRLAILGIGQALRGDDGVGLAVAQELRPFAHENLLIIQAAHAPENCTGQVCRFQPDLVLLVDAAQMNEPPGTIRWLDWQACDGVSASSHTLPLTMLGRYLTAVLPSEVALLGVQPATLEIAESLSPQVAAAARQIVQAIANLRKAFPVD